VRGSFPSQPWAEAIQRWTHPQTNLDASHSDLGAFDIVALRVLLCWEARAVKKELTPSSLCLSGGATPTKRRPNPRLDPRMWDGEGPHVPTATAGRSSTAPGTRNRVDRSTLQLRWVPTPLLPSLSWVLHRSLRRVRCLTPDAARGCSCRANALVCRSRVVAAQEKF
jgi:hypothetical protein